MRGGRRSGAGRKKGSVSKLTEVRQDMIARATAKGITPLEFMLEVLRDPTQDFAARFDAAKSAAPYVHPRLAAVEHSGDKKNPVAYRIMTGVPRPQDVIEQKLLSAASDAGDNDDTISTTAH